MRSWFWVIVAVTVSFLAGCLGPEADADDDDVEEPGLQAWTLEGEVSGCPESIGVVLMEPASLQALLPENFTARDAGDFFDLGMETGRGVLFFNSVECTSSGYAEVAVYTNAPTVEGFPAADFDFYTLGYASDQTDLLENLSRVGATVENATVSAEVEALTPGTGLGSADVAGGAAMSYAFETAGSAPQPFEFTARFWQEVPTGLVLWQYELPGQEAFAGPLTSCAFPAGSLVAGIVGQEDCMGLETASIAFPDQAYASQVRYLPGGAAQG